MMARNKDRKISKFLSLVLRHKPEEIKLKLSDEGWAEVDELLEKMRERGFGVDRAILEEVVRNNDKQRFAFNSDHSQIRANQGHSIPIELGYEAKKPPKQLYHGTARRFVDAIFREGLQKRGRHHVHLSKEQETALKVGQRHGKPVILLVLAEEMHHDGYQFYESENGVWLVDEVPVKYLASL